MDLPPNSPTGPAGDPEEFNEFDVTLPASAMEGFRPNETESDGVGGGLPAPMPRTADSPVVPEIADVSVGALLGKGGQGVVYRGFQEFLARDVAIKVLHRSVDRDLARFRQEATLLASLQHPNIVACYQAGVGKDEECYMVLEFVDGPDLFGYVRENGALGEAAALSLALDVARGLEHGYEHGSRMIHRDIKPQNILIQERKRKRGPGLRAKVVDLGLARCLEESMELTRDGAVMGTPISMAPEQFDCPKEADHRTDMYGLGCVLFYALTGDPAFKGATLTAIYKQKVDTKTARPHKDLPISRETKGLLDKMLAPVQGDRPESYQVLIRGIRDALDALEPGTPRRRAPWILPVGIGAAVLAVAGVAAVLSGDSDPEEPLDGGRGATEAAIGAVIGAGAQPGAVSSSADPEPTAGGPDNPASLGQNDWAPNRKLPALLDALAPAASLQLIQDDSQLVSWRGGYDSHENSTREHAFWRFNAEAGTSWIEGQPAVSFEGKQAQRSSGEFLDDLRGRGDLVPQFQSGVSELSHAVPRGSWAFEGDLALRRRSPFGELLGGVCFHRSDGSFLEVAVGVVLAPGEAVARKPRAVVRSAWFAPDGAPMGERFIDARDFPGDTTARRSENFMEEGAAILGEREEVVVSVQLLYEEGESIAVSLGDYLILELASPPDLDQHPVRQVTAFARQGDLALRRWCLIGD